MNKRSLLGTTALMAVGLVCGPSEAQIEMRLGGFMTQWFGYGDNDEAFDLQEVEQWSDSEVFFLGQGTTDNGLTFGVNVQLEGNTEGDQIDESFLFLSGDFGRINIGSENSAGYLMQTAAPAVALAINSGSQTQHIHNPTEGNLFRSPFGSTFIEPARDNDGQKLTYFTPRFFGVQLGVSYLPDIDGDGGDRNGLISDTDEFTNGISIGVNYENSFGDFGVLVSGGYYYAEAPDSGFGTVVTPGGNSVDLEEDFQGFSAGATFVYNGFEIGGSYAEVTDGILSVQSNGDVYTTESRGFDVGIAYGMGPWSVSYTYYNGEEDGLIDVDDEIEHQSHVVGARYDLGASIALVGAVGYSEFEDEGNIANDNDGVFVTGGVALSF
ncbi:MAG: porin [Alphaproteobacteria bacterium]|jgi:hypothetical protein|nr:porin [Alphaproteobacteria bacterium]